MVSARTVIFVDHASALSGAERSLLLLLKHLDRARWAPRLACTGGPLAEAAAALEVPVHTVAMDRLRRSPRAPLDWLGGACAIARLAHRLGVSLLVANTVRAAFYAALAGPLARVPFVWHMRDFWLSESRPPGLLTDVLGKHLLCGAATRVIANSRATAGHLPCQSKVCVILNSVEVDRFDPPLGGGPFRHKHRIPTEAPLVGTIGRLRPWKGQDRFLRMLSHVHKTISDVWSVVVGGSPFDVQDDYPQRLRRLAADLNLDDRVVFTGHLSDVRSALAAMDVFVHPGDPEPFGLVNLEAMAMGKPVVAFAHGALPEIVMDGETGLLVTSGDVAALGDAVTNLLSNPSRQTTMGQAGRTRVEERFTAERMARELEAALQEVAR